MLTVKKHIQYFHHQTILDSNVDQGLRMGGQQPALTYLCLNSNVYIMFLRKQG